MVKVKVKVFDFEASDSRKTGVSSLGLPGGCHGTMAPPHFGRSVNPISTRGGRLYPPNAHQNGTLGFSDLPTALKDTLKNH